MTAIRDFLEPSSVILDLNETDHDEVVLEMIGHLCQTGKISSVDCYGISNAILERESQVGTGVGSGVAIPHARIRGLKKPLAVFGRSREGVNFDCPDNAPSRLIFLLLMPDDKPAQHLQILAEAARILDQSDRRRMLEEATSPEEVCDIFSNSIRT